MYYYSTWLKKDFKSAEVPLQVVVTYKAVFFWKREDVWLLG